MPIIESWVSNTLDKANKSFYQFIDQNLTVEQKEMINITIKELEDYESKSEMTLLKLIPGKPNINTLNEQIHLPRKSLT